MFINVLSLNIPDSSLFFVEKLQPPLKKVTPLFPSNPPLKTEDLSSPSPLFENLIRGSPPPLPPLSRKGGGAHYESPVIFQLTIRRKVGWLRSFRFRSIRFFYVGCFVLCRQAYNLMKGPKYCLQKHNTLRNYQTEKIRFLQL